MVSLTDLIGQADLEAESRRREGEALHREFYAEIKTPLMAHKGIDVVRKGDIRVAELHNFEVFEFYPHDAKLIIRPRGKAPEAFTDLEEAKTRAAALLNAALRDPHWGEEGVRVRAPRLPLYPV